MVTKKKIAAGHLTCTVQPRKHSLDPFRLTYDTVPACTGLLVCHCCSNKCSCQIRRTLCSSNVRTEKNYKGRRLGSSMLFFLIRVTDFIDTAALTSGYVNILWHASFRTDWNIQGQHTPYRNETNKQKYLIISFRDRKLHSFLPGTTKSLQNANFMFECPCILDKQIKEDQRDVTNDLLAINCSSTCFGCL